MRAIGFVVLAAAAVAACNEDDGKFQLSNEGGVPSFDSGTPVGSDGGQSTGGTTGPVVG
ncbi:MAG TPA: hypothetical protein VFX59_18400 [Polyangiales bacterium]|nr:hypothetical protein [Polyangiales bacterium]